MCHFVEQEIKDKKERPLSGMCWSPFPCAIVISVPFPSPRNSTPRQLTPTSPLEAKPPTLATSPTPRQPPKMSLPPIATLPTLPHDALTAALDLLFEPTRHLHDLVLPALSSPFPSYPALIATIRDRLHALVREANHDPARKHALHGILGSHPRLGEPREGVLSEASKMEQRNLKTGGDEAEAEGRELARLNKEYEEVFPGLRYVVFVDGRGRGEVMADMRGRMEAGRGRLAGQGGEGKEGTMEGEEERGVDVSLFLCGSVSDLGRGANQVVYRPCAILRWIGRERYWPRILLEGAWTGNIQEYHDGCGSTCSLAVTACV